MAGGGEGQEWRAPYIAYATLINFIDIKCGANPVPPRIDRSFLDNYSGSVQPLLLGTLRTIGLIDENNQVQPALRQAARSPALCKTVLRSWAAAFYKEQSELAEQHATSEMLQRSFAKHQYQGSTLRKAIVFYLSLADDVGLPKSPHFKPPKQQGPGSSRARPPRQAAPAAEEAPRPPPDLASHEREDWHSLTVRLKSGGTIKLLVDVNPLALKGEERVFFYKLVDHLDGYEQARDGSGDSLAGAPTGTGEAVNGPVGTHEDP